MKRLVEELVKGLLEARYAVALTGAGVSTDSGIPDFRSPGSGLWRHVNPMQVASIEGFFADPVRFYEFWCWRFAKLSSAVPNITHRLLAELEERGILRAVITQNIDDLHRKAGSKRVLEAHGNFTRGRCVACRKLYAIEEIFVKVERAGLPRCDDCGQLLKPDVVLFGELLPPSFEEAMAEVERSDLLWVLGTSLEVYPVAGLVPQAKQEGAKVFIVNREPTPFDGIADLVIHSELAPVMERVRLSLR
ncbi:MAG: NAD-dependent deacylase [Candidatus Bipolaricaulota bacterium]|nr:NAD-dependent deacylase [Candidatus Bipolaricaulota bacterium]MCS7274925.1 NAD-dependent deacylase [Candidatus Bipolaricaulota bacterium]MDW8110292.1 NAD-dependent deacylase [Candidatus Bipolaricaulota bacterium]MDW8328812.1 NAD-dependent deacylase [Candidatus Bipolaricaulota bacterium]